MERPRTSRAPPPQRRWTLGEQALQTVVVWCAIWDQRIDEQADEIPTQDWLCRQPTCARRYLVQARAPGAALGAVVVAATTLAQEPLDIGDQLVALGQP